MNAKIVTTDLDEYDQAAPRYEFHLENIAYDTRAEGAVYRKRSDSDVNTLVLTLTNTSAQAFPLLGGAMPKSDDSVPKSPTTLFLTFGNKDLSDTLSLDALVVEISTDGTTWANVSEPKAGWYFAHFKASGANVQPYVGLCPRENVELASQKYVKFRFTKLTCTYAGISSQRLQIGCYNLASGNRDSNLPLHVIDPPTHLKPLNDVFTPSLASRTLPHDWHKDPEVLITPEAVFHAVHDRLVNELKLTLSYTGLESGVDLSGSSFTLTFVAGTKYDTGALTAAGDISNITYTAAQGWKVVKQDATDNTPASWLITPPDKLKLTGPRQVDIIFTNIKIEQGFPPGLTYVSLINRNVNGYRDGHFAHPVDRSLAEASITDFRLSKNSLSSGTSNKLLRGAEEFVDFNSTVYLTWKAFVVPYLQLQYMTLDDMEGEKPKYLEYQKLDKDGTLSCVSFPVRNMKVDTGFTLRGYNTPPGNTEVKGHQPLVTQTSDLSVRVDHTEPRIDSFSATCSPTEAILQWTVTFGELESWLNVEIVEIVDEKVVRLYEPQPKDKKSGKCFLYPTPGEFFDEATKFKLQAWSSKLDRDRPTKEVKLGDGLELYRIKSFTATPEHPLVLGGAKTTLQWEFSFKDPGEVKIEQDSVSIPVEESKRATGPITVDNVIAATKLQIHAKRKDGPEASLDADVKTETVKQFLFRQTVKGIEKDKFNVTGWEGYYYHHWFYEYIIFHPENDEAEYVVKFGTDRTTVRVGCKSDGWPTEINGKYYLCFKNNLQFISNWYITGVPRSSPWDGNVFQFGQDQSEGVYKLLSVGEFKFLITPTGLEGGPNWNEPKLQFGWYGTRGWYNCLPVSGRTNSKLAFGR